MKMLIRAAVGLAALFACGTPAMSADPVIGLPIAAPAGLVPSTAVYCADASGKAAYCNFGSGGGSSGSSSGAAVADVFSTGPLNLATANATYVVSPANGANVVAFTIVGLTGSGATVAMESSNDNGATWNNFMSVSGSTGVITNSWTADASFSGNVAGRTRVRLRVSVAGTGTATVSANLSVAVRAIDIASPLPPGANVIGGVTLSGSLPAGANTLGGVTLTGSLPTGANTIGGVTLAAPLPGGANVIGGVTAADGAEITIGSTTDATWSGTGAGTVNSVLKYIATGPTAAGTNLIGRFGIDQTTLGLSNGVTLVDGLTNTGVGRVISYTDVGSSAANGLLANARMQLFNGSSVDRVASVQSPNVGVGTGVVATGVVPTSAAPQGLTPLTVANTSASALKATAGNVFSLTGAFNTTAGFVILYDAAATPASGAALNTTAILWYAAVPASGTFDKTFPIPPRVTAGAQLLASTSLTTYTPPATIPLLLTGQVK